MLGYDLSQGFEARQVPDEDGDCLSGGQTEELMYGAAVRVLIPTDTDQATATRLLKKITEWVESGHWPYRSEAAE